MSEVELKKEHQMVVDALERACEVTGEPVVVADVDEKLSPQDRAHLDGTYANDLTNTLSKILHQLADREVVQTAGVIAGKRYYFVEGAVDREDLPDHRSRRQRVRSLLEAATAEFGRPVLIGDLHAYAADQEPDLTSDDISHDIGSLLADGYIAGVEIRGDARGRTLYHSGNWDMKVEALSSLTWLEHVAATVNQMWSDRRENGGDPAPVTTGEVRTEIRSGSMFQDRLQDPQLLVNALKQLATTPPVRLKMIRRGGEKHLFWVPADATVPENRRPLFASDAERVQEAVRLTEDEVGHPVSVDEVALTIERNPFLALRGRSPLHQSLSDASRTDSTRRKTTRLHHVGTVGEVAYYSSRGEGCDQNFVRLERARYEMNRRGLAAELSEADACPYEPVRIGRQMLLKQQVDQLIEQVESVAEHCDLCRKRHSNVTESADIPELPHNPRLPTEVDNAVEGLTHEQVREHLDPVWRAGRETVSSRDLISLLAEAVRRIPNPDYKDRFREKPEKSAKYLFDAVSLRLVAAQRWGGHEAKLHAARAVPLGPLRDMRFVEPLLSSPEVAERLAGASMLSFLSDGASLLLECVEKDPEPGVRLACGWGLWFTGHDENCEALKRSGSARAAALTERIERIEPPRKFLV